MSMSYFSGGDMIGGIEGGWFNFLGKLSSNLGENVCPTSDDHLHHGDVVRPVRGGSSATTYTMECKCDYCGELFRVKKTSSDLSAAYDDYVQALPADNINSQGLSEFYITGWTYEPYNSYNKIISSLADYPCVDSYNTVSNATYICGTSGSFTVPQTGQYSIVFPRPTLSMETSYSNRGRTYLTGGSYNEVKIGDCDTGFSYKAVLVAGTQYTIKANLCAGNDSYKENTLCSYRIYRPYVQGSRSLITTDNPDIFNTTTRPTSITGGNYGIVGDNNEITKVQDNSTIINETNNTYYNPATGTKVPITNWSYDYSDRSYKVTLENGDTATVTYGDENISIVENTTVSGDTITNNYTIYYLVEGSGEPPTDCPHDWQKGDVAVPTCTLSGTVSYVCSLCGQVKIEYTPALGHDWQVKQAVTTQYDDTGQLTQQGYTIFECSRCGEQYKSTDGTAPPDTVPDDTGEEEGGGFLSWLWHTLTDAVKKLIGGIVDAILKTLDFFFGGDSQSNSDFYTSPSTFSGVSVWG